MNRNVLNRIRRIKNIVRFGYLHLVSHGRLVAMKNQYSSGRSMYKMFGGVSSLDKGAVLKKVHCSKLQTDIYS